MRVLVNASVPLTAFYTDFAGAGVTGLTVTIDIKNPSNTLVVSAGSCSEFGAGFYGYNYTPTVAGFYKILFKTVSTSVAQTQLPLGFFADTATAETLDAKIDVIDGIVDTINSNVTTIDGNVDDIETALGSLTIDLSPVIEDTEAIQAALVIVAAKIDVIDGNVDDIETAVATVDGIVDTIDSNVDAILADTVILTGGAGSRAVTIQLYETATTTPIVDANVAAYNAGGDIMAEAISSAAGQVLFALADGAHTVRLRKAGVVFAVGTITVSGNGTFTLYGTPATIPAPITGDGCTVYDYCYDQASGSPLASVTATAEIIHLPYDYNGKLHTGASVTGTYSAASGIVSWDVAQGADVTVDITELGIKHKITVPAAATARIADLL